MVTGLWTAFLLSLACASAIAWLAALVKTQPKSGRILIGAAFASAWIIAGAKPGGVRSGDGAPAVAGGGLSLFFFDPHGLPRLFADPLDITIWAFTRFALRCGTIGNI